MGVTNVSVNGLTIHVDNKYAVGADTLTMLEAMAPYNPVMVDMQDRPPSYQRSQVQARPITLVVYFLRTDANDRKTDYDALAAALDPRTGLRSLTWTTDGVTKRLMICTNSLVPATWFASASAEIIAPNPYPVTV